MSTFSAARHFGAIEHGVRMRGDDGAPELALRTGPLVPSFVILAANLRTVGRGAKGA